MIQVSAHHLDTRDFARMYRLVEGGRVHEDDVIVRHVFLDPAGRHESNQYDAIRAAIARRPRPPPVSPYSSPQILGGTGTAFPYRDSDKNTRLPNHVPASPPPTPRPPHPRSHPPHPTPPT